MTELKEMIRNLTRSVQENADRILSRKPAFTNLVTAGCISYVQDLNTGYSLFRVNSCSALQSHS